MPGMSRDIVYEDDKLAERIPNHAFCYLDELLWTKRVGTQEDPGATRPRAAGTLFCLSQRV
jgi:hypothetical protein